MNVGEVAAIIGSLLAIGGVIFQMGQTQSRFTRTERDVDNLANQVRINDQECYQNFETIRKEVETLKQEKVLLAEKIRCLEEHGS